MITDFEEIKACRNLQPVETPAGYQNYQVHAGGNFFFITNPKQVTVRFHQPLFTMQIHPGAIEGWIRKIRTVYPNF